MEFNWSFFIDLGIISVALLVATLIRAKVRFFQRFLIPNALTAGFILLPFYNFAAPALGISSAGLGEVVYHLLSISFVAMMLRPSDRSRSRSAGGPIRFATAVLFQYGAQAFIGMMLTILFIAVALPQLFPSFGLLLPLGYALGPGQAFSIGSGWERFGFLGGGDVGLTFAAIGFLIACFAGVVMINLGVRRGWLGKDIAEIGRLDTGPGIHPRGEGRPVGSRLSTESDAIDTMSLNLGMVVAVYFLSYLFLQLITWALSFVGPLGADLAANLWGIGFVFATIIALLVKQLARATGADHVLDAGSLTRISGTSIDFTVAAAVGAISLVIVGRYWVPIVVIAGVAGLFVFFTAPWMASRLFSDHKFHRTLMLFGAMTGTLPTGLALLRVVDPDFKTPVATDYVYSSAIVFVLAIPLILTMNLPAYSVSENRPEFVWIMVAIIAAYVVVSVVLYLIFARGPGGGRAFTRLGRLWYEPQEPR